MKADTVPKWGYLFYEPRNLNPLSVPDDAAKLPEDSGLWLCLLQALFSGMLETCLQGAGSTMTNCSVCFTFAFCTSFSKIQKPSHALIPIHLYAGCFCSTK